MLGRITVHPQGFGCLNLDGPEGESAAFITPPDLNPFLDGDLVQRRRDEHGARPHCRHRARTGRASTHRALRRRDDA